MKNTCCICGNKNIYQIKGHARDNKNIVPLKCADCGHVILSSLQGADVSTFSSGKWKAVDKISQTLIQDQFATDAARRYSQFNRYVHNCHVLEFGSGNGAFLALAKTTAKSVTGIDLDQTYKKFYHEQNIPFYSALELLPEDMQFDFIVLFHVLDHIENPIQILKKLKQKLNSKGKIVIETPNADDALLSLYDCDAFADFTYYASHLHLFSKISLENLIQQAGFSVSIEGFQRYPLSNHLYWLAKGLPGGQKFFTDMNDPVLNAAYAQKLINTVRCDTLIATCKKNS